MLAVAEALLLSDYVSKWEVGSFSAAQNRCCILTFLGAEQELETNGSLLYYLLCTKEAETHLEA